MNLGIEVLADAHLIEEGRVLLQLLFLERTEIDILEGDTADLLRAAKTGTLRRDDHARIL